MEPGGFIHLLRDWNHWGFELVANIVIDGLLIALIWPRLRDGVLRHVHRDIEKASGKKVHHEHLRPGRQTGIQISRASRRRKTNGTAPPN